MTVPYEDLLRLVLAVVVGGLLGAEREYREKPAGFRTLIFICLGATLFTTLSRLLAPSDDPVRIAANIVTGIGFLGAGAILREGNRVEGLTTAAAIWLTAALGMGLGGGQYALVAGVTALTLIVLWAFPWIEARIERSRDAATYQITCTGTPEAIDQLCTWLPESRLDVKSAKRLKSAGMTVYVWSVFGPPERHAWLVEKLLNDERVVELKY
jgi:putative Mg2+ transporter-C (MgtC) family protein